MKLSAAFRNLFFVLSTAIFSQQVSAHNSALIENKHINMDVSLSNGIINISLKNDSGKIFYTTISPGIFLDKVKQNNFRFISADPFIIQNDALKVSFFKISERSIAIEYDPINPGLKEFEFHLNSDDETEYYGMGERFNAINQRGYILPNITDDRYGIKGVGTHKPIPFFMSSKGLGIWVDSFSPGTFDLNGSERFLTRINFTEEKFRVVLICGEQLAEIIDEFTNLTGRPALPPPWAFGLWKSRDVHHNRDSISVDIEKLRRYKIPASVLVIDSPWETGYNNFEINTEQFEEHEKMFDRIKELGFNLCLWLTPFVNNENVIDMEGIHKVSNNFLEADQNSYLVKKKNGETAISEWWKGKGGLIDFTNPAAVKWWNSQMKKMLDYGVKAFKCDDGEGNFVPEALFYDGTSAYQMKNRYSLLYDSVMQNFINEYLDGDGVLITRSGYTGFQKYPFAWAGDNNADFSFANGLPSVILAGQNAALSGISLWGTDIAGYAGTPTKELFIRWTQFAVFSPFMQVHMTSNLGPWDFDEETLDIFRNFSVLRTRLFPYLYNAVNETVENGMPVIRPMVLAFQNDAEAGKNIFQFMFGNDILVAPIYQPGNFRTLYLPEGEWYDYWTGEIFNGKKYYEIESPLNRIPLFVRSGSVIPLLPSDVQTLVERNPLMADSITAIDNRRILQIWPGSSAELKTWDKISAKLSQNNGSFIFDFSSEGNRPIDIEVMFTNLENIRVKNGVVSFDKLENKTIISFSNFQGSNSFSWEAE